jgi:hypothetical protein
MLVSNEKASGISYTARRINRIKSSRLSIASIPDQGKE